MNVFQHWSNDFFHIFIAFKYHVDKRIIFVGRCSINGHLRNPLCLSWFMGSIYGNARDTSMVSGIPLNYTIKGWVSSELAKEFCQSRWPYNSQELKIQQTKMLVNCQRFGDLFLFGLIWQYSSNHKTYDKGRFKVIAVFCEGKGDIIFDRVIPSKNRW